ncbi:two-component system nitrogen regulation sensor histidine kinase GlnL [Plasticicumulans lactativorans]|uniref:Sensory histidine kinase/phosphatase NtrB n=1 Tax=Plasticicumulans lactativorans TaxID=1133106 RepID=A0A4R2L7W2_9GAMM|nr:nitrogen regulation protein NR(II) [Plasticicumulans lactativorans]TCO82746.1 two-component system nitrogen regulation sensor histidine kinase GlnL [Plasticicumulans lactativorans]
MYREIAVVVRTDYPRRVMDNMTTGVIVLDRNLRTVYMNPAAEMLFALSFRQALGANFSDLAIGAEALIKGMRRCLEAAHPYTERGLQLTLPGEHLITVDCTVTPIVESEQPLELLVELRQVDRQLRITREENLIAQQTTAQALVRNLAHEIKNPLGGLRGAAQLLEREFGEERLKEYTRIIIHEADRLRGLVDRMLGPTRPPVRTETNIHEVLERVRSLVLVEGIGSTELVRDYDPSIPMLKGDPDQLVQALLNIVRNAVQALAGQGTITLRTRVQRQCTIGAKRHKLVVRVDIVDDGPGIPEAIAERIFYPMITGRADGTGLGLSIAQGLVSQHGGLIECTSQPGETTFTLLLPME